MNDLSPELLAYLTSWHNTSTRKQMAKGVVVELSLSDFIGLFQKRQLQSLQKSIDHNRLRYFQSENNHFAYVATWKSYAACSTNVWSKDTAFICSRNKSATINLPQTGDKLRPAHCANISKSLTGKAKTAEHRAAISDSTKGQPKAGWSLERKAARSALRQAQEAAKRGGAL